MRNYLILTILFITTTTHAQKTYPENIYSLYAIQKGGCELPPYDAYLNGNIKKEKIMMDQSIGIPPPPPPPPPRNKPTTPEGNDFAGLKNAVPTLFEKYSSKNKSNGFPKGAPFGGAWGRAPISRSYRQRQQGF